MEGITQKPIIYFTKEEHNAFVTVINILNKMCREKTEIMGVDCSNYSYDELVEIANTIENLTYSPQICIK